MTQGLNDPGTKRVFDQTHHQLQTLWLTVAQRRNIILLDGTRGKAAQEQAFKEGHSLAHFGDSAHNYIPCVANDVVPDGNPDWLKRKIDWKDVPAFLDLHKVIEEEANKLGLFLHGPKRNLRWGGDWDGDGDRTDQRLSDLPHYELHPWRVWAKESRLAT